MHDTKGMMQDEQLEAPSAVAQPRRTGRRLLVALLLLLLLLLGGALFAAWRFPATQQRMATLVGLQSPPVTGPARPVLAAPGSAPQSAPVLAAQSPAAPAMATPAPVGPLDLRLAALENRLNRLDIQAEAASGNAARAEGLLIAYATRRTLDRGAPLGYLEDQLRLRFADAQPNSVKTLIDAAHTPVTLDMLYAQLEALAPKLAGASPNDDNWTWAKRELASLFVIRHQTGPTIRPQDLLASAKLMLAAGKTSEAIGTIERLPGAREAQPWIASARRYDAVQRALDLIETTAMLDPHRLKDGAGSAVNQPSPLLAPGD
jgi:hypothetical protein